MTGPSKTINLLAVGDIQMMTREPAPDRDQPFNQVRHNLMPGGASRREG